MSSSLLDRPIGVMCSIRVHVGEVQDDLAIGSQVPSGVPVAFKHVGLLPNCQVSLYDVCRTGQKMNAAWILQLNESFPPCHVRPPQKWDLGYAHDVCCGIGGFSTAMEFLGLQVVTGVDSSQLALQVFEANHKCPTFSSPIGLATTVFQMHWQQSQIGCQPLVCTGFPCQPLSNQGYQMRQDDPRSQVLGHVVEAAFLLNAVGLLLECVPEALTDGHTQRTLKHAAKIMDLEIVQGVLHLDSVWPSRRTRWFAVLLPKEFGNFGFPPLPRVSPTPAVEHLIPADFWPLWAEKEESQLRWTHMEQETYKDPTYGPIDRQICQSQPLATALHSWGNALYKCPCDCRQAGLSPKMLQAKGLRGVEVRSSAWPHPSRHIHPKELQLLLGFPPMQVCHEDCRSQLCLFGNSVSPIQVIWVMSHVLESLGLLPTQHKPLGLLAQYCDIIVRQRNLVWPPPFVGTGTIVLDFAGTQIHASFHTGQQVQDLLKAEATLQQADCELQLWCENNRLPNWAYIQEKQYQLILSASPCQFSSTPVVVTLEFLGLSHVIAVPATFTYHMLVTKVGVHSYEQLVDDKADRLEPTALVDNGKTVIIQLDPDLVQISTHLKMEEFQGFGPLRFTELHPLTGLWHLDEQIKNHTIASWAGLGFAPITIWLPSFTAAIWEFWPGTLEQELRTWMKIGSCTIYALVHEIWGWNLVRFMVSEDSVQVDLFEPCNAPDHMTAFLISRVQAVSEHKAFSQKRFSTQTQADGTLIQTLQLFDEALGLPHQLTKALRYIRAAQDPRTPEHEDFFACSPTQPWTGVSAQSPSTASDSAAIFARHGLSAKFIKELTQAWMTQEPIALTTSQVKIVCLEEDACFLQGLDFAELSVQAQPLFAFLLHNQHWTLVYCYMDSNTLHVVLYDGLHSTPLACLGSLIEVLKSAWKPSHVLARMDCQIVQTQMDSCGTVALAHFGLLIGTLTHTQGYLLEKQHKSLAVVSGILAQHTQVGYGPDEQSIVKALEQILPSKGVAQADVKQRAAAAIKVFGTTAIGKALDAKNPWASLKQLGNSKPKPFMWVTHAELQQHIQDRAQTKFGADLDIRKKKTGKQRFSEKAQVHIDPASLTIPAGTFVNNAGNALPQLHIADVQKDAQGIAFCTAAEAKPFLADGRFITGEALAVFVVDEIPSNWDMSLPMHQLNVPALYKGTGEPVIVPCRSVQLGDQAVFQRQNPQAPELQVFPTVVFRAHIFRDLWEQDAAQKTRLDKK